MRLSQPEAARLVRHMQEDGPSPLAQAALLRGRKTLTALRLPNTTEVPDSHGRMFTSEQEAALRECFMRTPIPLSKVDITQSFVYAREYGVFYVPFGKHPAAMSLLLAFQHGLTDGIDIAHELNLDYSDETADHWLEHTPGAAFKSSVGQTIQAGKFKHLNAAERKYFLNVSYIFD